MQTCFTLALGYTCTSVAKAMKVLPRTRKHALHLHWGTHAFYNTCTGSTHVLTCITHALGYTRDITHPSLMCLTYFQGHEGFLATLIFCGVFYPCLYPSFCPCLCRVCLDLDACPCPCLSSVLYLCRVSPCLDVCLYAGVVLYPCLFPNYLSHLEMLTFHSFQHQLCLRFPFLSKLENHYLEKRNDRIITNVQYGCLFPTLTANLAESDQKDFWELL